MRKYGTGQDRVDYAVWRLSRMRKARKMRKDIKYPPLVQESRKALADELRGMAESVRTMEAEDIGQQWADSQESSDRCVW